MENVQRQNHTRTANITGVPHAPLSVYNSAAAPPLTSNVHTAEAFDPTVVPLQLSVSLRTGSFLQGSDRCAANQRHLREKVAQQSAVQVSFFFLFFFVPLKCFNQKNMLSSQAGCCIIHLPGSYPLRANSINPLPELPRRTI